MVFMTLFWGMYCLVSTRWLGRFWVMFDGIFCVYYIAISYVQVHGRLSWETRFLALLKVVFILSE